MDPQGKRTGLAGFGSLNKDDEDDEDKRKRNEYYSGGKASGVAVIGGPNADEKEDGGQVVERLTKQAKESGAAVESYKEPEKAKFTGTGVSLTGEQVQGNKAPPKPVTRILTMYEDGFTVDDGPFRAFDDPANKAFLDDIGKGMIPRELEQEAQGGELQVDLVDKRGQKFEAPRASKPKVQAFTGAGQSLTGSSNSNNSNAPAVTVAGQMTPVDETKPTTRLQIRTGSGARVVGVFNPDTHTLMDVLRYAAAKGHAGVSLTCTMPRHTYKTAAELGQTIAAAKLQGAALMLDE